jgi:hypothetical protein
MPAFLLLSAAVAEKVSWDSLNSDNLNTGRSLCKFPNLKDWHAHFCYNFALFVRALL